MTYYVTFSRAGQAIPYETAYQRQAGLYAPGELVPMGGNLEILPGNLCGTGNITLNRPPRDSLGQRMRPTDWVRVYLGDSDQPLYLGEVSSESWWDAGGEVKLTSLKERVSRCAWRSNVEGSTVQLYKASFKAFVTEALTRCVLPPGITIGDIPDEDVTLQALRLFEQIGDTLQATLPALRGATWGVNALGQVVVHRLSSVLTHRFPRGRSDTPPGSLQKYANCVRFGYKAPAGIEAWFELKLTPEIEKHGEAWTVETLTSNVRPTLENPWKNDLIQVGWGQTFYSPIPPSPYRDEPWPYHQPDLIREDLRLRKVFETAQYVSHPAMNPDWTGKLADGITAFDDVVLSADELPILTPGEERIQLDGLRLDYPTSSQEHIRTRANLILQSALPAGVRLVVRNRDTGAQHSKAYTPGEFLTTEPHDTQLKPSLTNYPAQVLVGTGDTYTGAGASPYGTEHPKAVFWGQYEYEVFYDPDDLAAYHAANGHYPNGFLLRIVFPEDQYYSEIRDFRLTACSRADPTRRGWVAHMWAAATYTGGPYLLKIVVGPLDGGLYSRPKRMIASSFAQVRFAQPRQWLGGDAITTDATVSSVDMVLPDGSLVPFTRMTAENGRVTWGLAQAGEFTSAILRLSGDPRGIGFFTVSIVDTASLLGYAAGLLRYRAEPVRSWVGHYYSLERIEASGMARFEYYDTDVDLDVVRVAYDLTAGRVAVEAGTPQALDDAEALSGVVDGIERIQRYSRQLPTAGGT